VHVPTWGWILIAAAAVVIVALVAWGVMKQRRTKQLQEQFGPEYGRTRQEAKSKRAAESELAARQARREKLDIRPLSASARERYTARWQTVQAEFVDNPDGAVASADELIQAVMEDRGYPVEQFESRAADISVDHPQVVDNYRQGHRLAQQSAKGNGSTEDLRQAMRNYRALFEELVDADGDRPTTRGRDDDASSDEALASRERERS